jgi:hypothetical protein
MQVVDIERLFKWTSHVMLVIEREKAAPKASSGGFFSYFSRAAPEVKLEDYESLFQNIQFKEDLVLVPLTYVWLQFRFCIDGGIIKLHHIDSEINLEYSNFLTQAFLRPESFDL